MNNKSKKIAAACLALAMVASVGAADVAGVLPVVKPVTASAEGSDKLSDGEYYVNLSLYDNYDQTNTSSFKELPTYAKLKVENGKYFVTMTITTSYDILLLEKVKNDKYDTDAQSTQVLPKACSLRTMMLTAVLFQNHLRERSRTAIMTPLKSLNTLPMVNQSMMLLLRSTLKIQMPI